MDSRISIHNSILELKIGQIIVFFQKFLDCPSYETLSMVNSKTVWQIINYSTLLCLSKGTHLKLWELLRKCNQYLQKIVNLSQFLKYGHRFSKLSSLNRKLTLIQQREEGIFVPKVAYQLPAQHKQIELNRILCISPIQQREILLLNQGKINEYFKNLLENRIEAQNSSCICCSRIFIKNVLIGNTNPAFSVILDGSEKKIIDNINIQKVFNGVCNRGGGVVLFGCQRKNGQIRPVGMNLEEGQSLQLIKKIQSSITNIKPNVHYYIEKIIVHSNPIQKDDQISQQYQRYCFRVRVFPPEKNKLTFIQIKNKGYHDIFKIYKLESSLKPYQLLVTIRNQKIQSPYEEIHKKARQKSQFRNLHTNILCYRPSQRYSYRFYQLFPSGNFSKLPLNKTEQCPTIKSDNPIFKFLNTGLLIVGSKKNDRYVEEFAKILKTQKQQFDLQKPFSESFKDGARSIWLISHQSDITKIKKWLKYAQAKNSVKPGSITMMPVYNTLQIEHNKLSEQSEKELEDLFQARFKQKYQKQVCVRENEGQKQTFIYLNFNEFSQSIFAYMVFQKFHLKPYFIKSGTTYKKKGKFQEIYVEK